MLLTMSIQEKTMSVHLSNTMAWIFLGSVSCLFCYIMGYIIGETVTKDKLKQTRGQMEIDEEENEKELKIKDVKPEKNNSEEN